MGLFDSIKGALGLGGGGELVVMVQPERLHVGGRIEGAVTFDAKQAVNLDRVELELAHTFPDYEGTRRDIIDMIELDQRVAFAAGQQHRWEFFFDVPWGVAPAVAPFGWELTARALVAGGSIIKKGHVLPLRMSPVVDGVVRVIQGQFGFNMVEFGAEEDCQWVRFEPQGAVRNHFQSLIVSYAEEAEGTSLWVDLRSFRPSVLRSFADSYDPRANEIELALERRAYTIGHQADSERIQRLLQPLFSLT